MELTPTQTALLLSILDEWDETFRDPKAYPPEEYPDLWHRLAEGRTLRHNIAQK